MEERSLAKKMFQNYLRDLYIEVVPEEVEWIKSIIENVSSASWCCILKESRKIKGLLSYYLVSKGCPEYLYITSSELVERRFDDDLSIQEFIDFGGIVILKHSSAYIRNKLTFETLLHIVAEREYKNKPTIVISDIAKDSGDHIYYDHERVSKYIQCCVSVQNSSGLIHRAPSSPLQKITPTVPASVSVSTSASSCERTSRPLANLLKSKDRSKLIEENAKNAI